MKKVTLCVIFGGKSTEYDVSLKSAYAILENVDLEKYDLIKLGITKEGLWYIYEGDNEKILKDEWLKDRVLPVTFDISTGHLIVLDKNMYAINIDVIFPVLHGGYGEDGRLQGLFDIMGVRYVGCGAFASHICMDKSLAKTVAEKEGFTVAKSVTVNPKLTYPVCSRTGLKPNKKRSLPCVREGGNVVDERVVDTTNKPLKQNQSHFVENAKLTCPVFVKPTMSGSSVGVYRAENEQMLENCVKKALTFGDSVLIEEEIQGSEIEVGVMEIDGKIVVSPVGMIKYKGEFYDYDTKYNCKENEYIIPAKISENVAERVRKTAKRLFIAFGCKGLARLDFFLKNDGSIVFNEVNTMPGFTEISMFPKLFMSQGLSFGDIVDKAVEGSERREEKRLI